LTIYPNPTSGIFSIESSEKISIVEITNLLGEKVNPSNSLRSSEQGWSLDLSNQPDGIYVLSIKTNDGTATKKLIIRK